MTVISDLTKKPVDLDDKQEVIRLMESQTPSENRRLDGVDAFCAAYDVYVRSFDPTQHAEEVTKIFIKQHGRDEFLRIKNLKAMCWAFDWMRENFKNK